MSTPRETAVSFLHRILNRQPDSPADSESGSAFVKMLTLTALRHGILTDKILNRFITRKIPDRRAVIKTILICAVTELLFMDSPAYAVIDDYVDLAKKHGGKAQGGFVNAVLRNISRRKETIELNQSGAFFPDSFRRILRRDYSDTAIDQIEQAAMKEPPLNLTVKANPAFWAEKLHGQTVIGQTIAVTAAGKIETLPGYADGEWWIQDSAAALAAASFADLKGKRVLDLCAAPGGKTAQLINRGAKVTALDISSERLNTLRQNLERLKMQPEQIICSDAEQYLAAYTGEPFDAVLLDAPCSATGIFRRHPELVYLKTPDDIKRQAALQKRLLKQIPPVLKTGGELLYSTCSIAKAEGEEQIKNFIQDVGDFKIAALNCPEEPTAVTPEGFIRTLPFHFAGSGGCDAFFIAKLIKEA